MSYLSGCPGHREQLFIKIGAVERKGQQHAQRVADDKLTDCDRNALEHARCRGGFRRGCRRRPAPAPVRQSARWRQSTGTGASSARTRRAFPTSIEAKGIRPIRWVISAAISVARVPQTASIRPIGLVPSRNPSRLDRKHPKVTPQMPSGENRGKQGERLADSELDCAEGERRDHKRQRSVECTDQSNFYQSCHIRFFHYNLNFSVQQIGGRLLREHF